MKIYGVSKAGRIYRDRQPEYVTVPEAYGTKKCSMCKRELPEYAFRPDKRSKSGLSSACSLCMRKERDITAR